MPTYIDLRSDTVTRPSEELRRKMVNTAVGDDVFYDDPTINELQQEMADLFGKKAGILVPSGTMANIISMMLHCREKGEGAIIGDMTHINNWERGNIATAGSIMPITIQNQPDGTMDLEEIEFFIRGSDPHHHPARLLCLESSHNQCNGRVLRPWYIREAKKLARKHGLKMHLDGARALNAAAYLKTSPAAMCRQFDTVSVCLSKGLGCPVGSIIVGNKKTIDHALIIRKLFGGNMRQAGIYARAALENLKDWQAKMEKDHEKAQWLSSELKKISCIDIDTSVVETNIFRFSFQQDFKKFKHDEFAEQMRDGHGILMNFGHKNEAIRIVTHRDVSMKDMETALKAFKKVLGE